MTDPAQYSAFETLPNGLRIEVRALRPEDQTSLLSAVARTGTLSRYRRFFGIKSDFTDKEKAFFLNVDFIRHVALVAFAEEGGQRVIVGGGRYVVVRPKQAELAFMVVDLYQGRGVGAALMRHLAIVARAAGIQELIAEVLPENLAMLKVFERSGFNMELTREPEVVHVALRLA